MAHISAAQFGDLGEEQHPVPVAHDLGQPGSKDDATINRMAGRIVQTYAAATPRAHHLGETFYGHDAFGAADAIARGHDPNGRVGRLFRRAPVGAQGTPEANVAAHMPPEHQEALHRSAGVIARLSPQTEWETNVRQAHEAFQMAGGQHQTAEYNLRNDVRDTSAKPNAKGEQPRMQVRTDAGDKMDLNKQPSGTIRAAVDIARGTAPPEQYVANGDARVKIGSFHNNVEHPETSPHTTVDFRAHDIATGHLLSTSTDRGLSKTGAPPKEGKAPSQAYSSGSRHPMWKRRTTGPLSTSTSTCPSFGTRPGHSSRSRSRRSPGGQTGAPGHRARRRHAGRRTSMAAENGGVKRRADLGRPSRSVISWHD